jgi:hypothetical protein
MIGRIDSDGKWIKKGVGLGLGGKKGLEDRRKEKMRIKSVIRGRKAWRY